MLVSGPSQEGRELAIYDPSTGTFSPGPTLVQDAGALPPTFCHGGPPARMLDGRVFVPCPDGAALIASADGAQIATVPGQGLWTDAVALADGRVLVVDADGQAAFFEPATGQYKLAGLMGERRVDAEVVALADGRVLFIGGREGSPRDGSTGASRHVRSVERFDPATGQFTFVGLMHSARADHTATLLQDGRVLIVVVFAAPRIEQNRNLSRPRSSTPRPRNRARSSACRPPPIQRRDTRCIDEPRARSHSLP